MIIDKDNIKILLIILVLGLGIGYAYINSDLNINGTAQVNSANWDVHWENIDYNTNVKNANILNAPTIEANQTTVSYSIILEQPGDWLGFSVDAVNAGTIDAMIDTMSFKLNGSTVSSLPEYLKYDMINDSGISIQQNEILAAGTSKQYVFIFGYRDDISQEQLPTTDQTFNISFTITYRQANEDAIDYFYINNRNAISIGDKLLEERYCPENSDSGTIYYRGCADTISDCESNLSSLGSDYQCKKVPAPSDEIISESFPSDFYSLVYRIKKDGKVEKIGILFNFNDSEFIKYLLIGTSGNETYSMNKETLNNAFGSSKCTESSEPEKTYYCVDGDYRARATINGRISTSRGNGNCQFSSDLGAYCIPWHPI